ncbi:acyloxyacyl hydrolase [Arcobacteraceae bacterium]|nr:acyloxyacyl hydrolase [Arcobacteraceae bacterium]
MKKIIIYFLLTAYSIFASEVKDTKLINSISIGFGQNKLNKNVFKLGLQKDFTSKIYENRNGYLEGFYDLSLNKWDYKESQIYGLAFSPVFEYYFKTKIKDLSPFIHAGIGVTYISKTSADNKQYSTHFQFEDRIGLGVLYKKHKLSFDYFHYSNGSIKEPNDGIDIILINYMYKF